jgi:protein O-mannosyl-transferase
LWFFAGHLMESSILDLELYFEHRNYLPMLGPIVALTSIPFLLKSHLKKAGGVILSLWLSFLVIIASLQASVWGNQNLMAKLWSLEHPMSLRASQELARSQYESKNYQGAFDTLMNAHKRGLNYTDLPLAGLLTQCYIPSIKHDEDMFKIASEGSNFRPFTGAAIEAMSKLQTAVSENHCPDIINGEQWLMLSAQFLNNKKYPASKIRLLRAKYFYAKRDFRMTTSELELAYISGPSVELTQTLANVQLSAGHTSIAKHWLIKGLQLKQPFFDTLMYDPKDNSRKLLKAIDAAKADQANGSMKHSK